MSSFWNFIKRHRTKIIIGGGTIGGFMLLNRYLSSWEKAWQKSSSRDFVSEVKKKEIHFENTIDTCNTTCVSLSAKILDILDSSLDAEPILMAIKASPEKKIQLFDELKIRIFTRVISEVYCLVLFVAYLRIQLSVLSGYIYAENCTVAPSVSMTNGFSSLSASSALSSSSHVQQKYLSILQSFYSEGIHQIIEPVQSAVEYAMKDLSLKEKIVLKDLKDVFDKVKTSMSFALNGSNSNASRFLLNPEKITAATMPTAMSGHPQNNGHPSSSLNSKEAALLKRMFTETEDILESDDFRRVLDSGVDIGFSIIMDMLLGCFVRLGTDDSEHDLSNESNNGNSFTNPHSIHIPLAKLLPSIRRALLDRKSPEERLVMVRHLICLDVLNCFAANIYEAFCHCDSNGSAVNNKQ